MSSDKGVLLDLWDDQPINGTSTSPLSGAMALGSPDTPAQRVISTSNRGHSQDQNLYPKRRSLTISIEPSRSAKQRSEAPTRPAPAQSAPAQSAPAQSAPAQSAPAQSSQAETRRVSEIPPVDISLDYFSDDWISVGEDEGLTHLIRSDRDERSRQSELALRFKENQNRNLSVREDLPLEDPLEELKKIKESSILRLAALRAKLNQELDVEAVHVDRSDKGRGLEKLSTSPISPLPSSTPVIQGEVFDTVLEGDPLFDAIILSSLAIGAEASPHFVEPLDHEKTLPNPSHVREVLSHPKQRTERSSDAPTEPPTIAMNYSEEKRENQFQDQASRQLSDTSSKASLNRGSKADHLFDRINFSLQRRSSYHSFLSHTLDRYPEHLMNASPHCGIAALNIPIHEIRIAISSQPVNQVLNECIAEEPLIDWIHQQPAQSAQISSEAADEEATELDQEWLATIEFQQLLAGRVSVNPRATRRRPSIQPKRGWDLSQYLSTPKSQARSFSHHADNEAPPEDQLIKDNSALDRIRSLNQDQSVPPSTERETRSDAQALGRKHPSTDHPSLVSVTEDQRPQTPKRGEQINDEVSKKVPSPRPSGHPSVKVRLWGKSE